MPKFSNFCKPPTKRDSTIPDEIHTFQKMDKIKNTPFIEPISIGNNLDVKLHFISCPFPLLMQKYSSSQVYSFGTISFTVNVTIKKVSAGNYGSE